MNLEKLLSFGAVLPVQEFVKRPVTWVHGDEQRKKTITTFDVFIKPNISAADFEYIYANRENLEVLMARRVSRLIRLGEVGEEVISYETAAKMQPDLLIAFCKALNQVEKENAMLEADESKNSQPLTSSGTNLSSTESAAAQ